MGEITAITAVGLHGGKHEGGWIDHLDPEDSIHTLVGVHTDAGVIGHGSVFTNDRLVKATLDMVRPHYIGENPLEPERVFEKLSENTHWMGRGGSMTHTFSGIDIALWDILRKVTGQPVGRLLGGRYRTKVRPYCSLLMEAPDAMFQTIATFKAKGFRAFKIGWGSFGRTDDLAANEATVEAARNAAGPESLLMVDAGASDAFWPHGLKWALRTADMLAAYDIHWFEEPLRPDALEDYILLRRASRIPIAGGEVLTRRQTFRTWLAEGAFDIVQPDVTKVGGISEQRRIGWMANDYGVQFIGHGWNTALGVAADLHLASAFSNTDLVEYIGGSPYVDDITVERFALDSEGYFDIPDRPGIGVTLDPVKLKKYAHDASLLFETP